MAALIKKSSYLDISHLDVVIDVLRLTPKRKWQDLGLKLGLLQPTLDTIETNHKQDVERCLKECLSKWLMRVDKVDEYGHPTLSRLADALEEIDKTTAEKIIKTHSFNKDYCGSIIIDSQAEEVKYDADWSGYRNEDISGHSIPPEQNIEYYMLENTVISQQKEMHSMSIEIENLKTRLALYDKLEVHVDMFEENLKVNINQEKQATNIANEQTEISMMKRGIHCELKTKDVSVDTKELQDNQKDNINTGEDGIAERDFQIAKLKKENLQLKEKIAEQVQAIKTCSIGTQFDYLIPLIDNLNGVTDVQIAGRELFLVHGDVPHQFNWEQYGLRISVSKGTLSSSSDTAQISVFALIGGDFVFPENTKVISGVYAISVSEPLLQPLRLEIQHCVQLTSEAQTKYLKFAIAPVNTPSLPYQFSSVDGGEFTVGSWYGSIYRKEFSLVSMVGQVYEEKENDSSSEEEEEQVEGLHEEGSCVVKSKNTSVAASSRSLRGQVQQSTGVVESMTYAGLVYYEEKKVEDLVTFVAALKLNSLIQFIKTEHSQAEMGPNVFFRFKDPERFIELILNTPQEEPFDGWSIKPHTKPPRLYQDDIDLFGSKKYPIPPTCLISVYWSPDAVPSLHYGIPLEGVVRPVTIYVRRPKRTVSSPSLVQGQTTDFTKKTSEDQAHSDNKLPYFIMAVGLIMAVLFGLFPSYASTFLPSFIITTLIGGPLIYMYFNNNSNRLIDTSSGRAMLRSIGLKRKTILEVSALNEICTALKQGQFDPSKWFELGLQLGLHPNTLRAIRADFTDVETCLRECLTKWLQRADGVDERGGPTWLTLTDALENMECKATSSYIN